MESVMPSNHLILCHPLLLPPSIFPSIRVFSNESVLHIRWPKYWSFSFSISPSNEYSGLTSFRMDWLDLLAVQETLKNLLQHHSSKASILWLSACFIHEVLRGAKKGPGYSACWLLLNPTKDFRCSPGPFPTGWLWQKGYQLACRCQGSHSQQPGWGESQSKGWHHSSVTGTTLIHFQQDSPITFWREYLGPPSIFLIVS